MIKGPTQMPWHCPACSTLIAHLASEDAPRPGVVYRCPVCKLELTLDEKAQRLTVAPLGNDVPFDPRR